ncbi:MAG TPA: WD40 repeat domain-containing protein, partial [Bacteroidia bacterium]
MKNILIAFLIIQSSLIGHSQDLQRTKESAHSDAILSEAICNDGSLILTGGADKRAYLWDGKSGDKTKAFAFSTPVTAVAFSANGKTFAVGTSDGKLSIFDSKEAKLKKILKEHTLDITSISFNPINDYIVTASKDGSAKIWDGNSGGSLFTLKHAKAVNGAVFSPDGKFIATGSSDNTVKIWDAATGEMKKSLDADSKEVTAITWSADGKYIASGGSGGKVIIWESASGNKFAETNFKSYVNSLSISPDVQYLAAAGSDKKIIVWNIETKEVAKEFAAHDGDVTGIAFADKGNLFISVSKDMSLKFWDVSNLKIGKKKFVKDAGEPKLSTLNVSMKEDNHNGIIENPEKPTINFILKNSGKG